MACWSLMSKPDPQTVRRQVLSDWRRIDLFPAEEEARDRCRPIADLLKRVLADLRIDRRQYEAQIVQVWNHSLDPLVTAHAQPSGVHKGTLFVTVDSHVWLDEIVRYRRREIIERLQTAFGREMIAKISFRVG
jgi:hypothetical protein